MKTKLLLLTALLTLTGVVAQADEITKRIYRSYGIQQVSRLSVNNKYGSITIGDNRKDSVTIEVIIRVECSASKAQKLISGISSNITLSASNLSAETILNESFNNCSISIDYHISIPSNKELAIINKYGAVNLENLTANGSFDVKYGELNGGSLTGQKVDLQIAYSKANIMECKNTTLSLSYSKLSLSKCDQLTLNSKYSVVNLGTIGILNLESKYDDFKIEHLTTLKCNGAYTGFKIGMVRTSLEMINAYGNISVDRIDPAFNLLMVNSKYANVKLPVPAEASYQLNAYLKYANLKHPESTSLTVRNENNEYIAKGTVGKNKNTSVKVDVNSNYGNVSLQ